MTLPIISADQRLAEPRGIKGAIFGKSGIGKTSLLWTLDPATTLFIDLEAGDLAIEGWPGESVRPRTWTECRDFAVFIGGPNPALRDDQVYSVLGSAMTGVDIWIAFKLFIILPLSGLYAWLLTKWMSKHHL